MNKAKVIVSIFIFYSVIIYFVSSIGAETNSRIATQMSNLDIPTHMPYEDILNKSGMLDSDIFKLGEYGWSKNVNFNGVYVCSKSSSELGLYDLLPLTIHDVSFSKDPLQWIYNKIIDHRKIAFNDALQHIRKYAKENFSYGEHLYVYPDISIHYDKHWFHPNFWIVVGIFDANNPPNKWNDIQAYKLPLTYYDYRTLLQLNFGTMGYYDRYFVIDVIYTDVDLKGLSISDIVNYIIPSGKAQVVERYGGIIYGENHIPAPNSLTYHQLQLSKQYGTGLHSMLMHFIENFKNGMELITKDNPLGTLLYIIIFSPMIFLISWIIYTEAKSFIPFIRGGD